VLVTATTVGYGDLFPTTGPGKIVGTLAMLCGLLVLALPISIIGTNFLNCYEQVEARKRTIKALEVARLKEAKEAAEAKEEEAEAAKDQHTRALSTAAKSSWLKSKAKGPASLHLVGTDSSASKQQRNVNGHASLVGLKALARLTPSFLLDSMSAIFVAAKSDTKTGIVAVDRKERLAMSSISLFKPNPNPSTGVEAEHPHEEKLQEQYSPLVRKAQVVLDAMQNFQSRSKVDDPAVVNVCREVQDLIKKVVLLKEKHQAPLRLIGAQVDAALVVIFAWLSRDAEALAPPKDDEDLGLEEDDGHDPSKLDAEDERRLRILVLDFALTALESAKPPVRLPVDTRNIFPWGEPGAEVPSGTAL